MLDLGFLAILRSAELEVVLPLFPPPGARVLEIGAGTGDQARQLALHGYEVTAIDLDVSAYRDAQVFPIQAYDGHTFPFDDNSFDVVFSSNVLEHVANEADICREMSRVLQPGGVGIHLMPTPAWRLWTTLSAFPAAPQRALAAARDTTVERPRRILNTVMWLGSPLAQRRHGERGHVVSEIWLFRAASWRKLFADNGFAVVDERPTGLFYTGHTVLGASWSLPSRRRWAKVLGSACRVYEVLTTSQPALDRPQRSQGFPGFGATATTSTP